MIVFLMVGSNLLNKVYTTGSQRVEGSVLEVVDEVYIRSSHYFLRLVGSSVVVSGVSFAS